MTHIGMEDYITCPITREIIWEPVVAMDGNIYEKSAIEKWFMFNSTSPCTNLFIEKTLIEIPTFRSMVENLLEENKELKSKLFRGYNTHSNNRKVIDRIIIKEEFEKLLDYKDFIFDMDVKEIGGQGSMFSELLFMNCDDETVLNHVIENSLEPEIDDSWIQVTHIVCKFSSLSILKKLIELGHSINTVDEENSTLLHYACENENETSSYDLIEYLIEAGLDINRRNDFGYTPFHICCQVGELSCIKLLIENGADFSLKDKEGWYPIHYVCEFGELDAIKYFLSLDTDLEVVPNGYSIEKTPDKMIYKNSKLSEIEKKEALYLYLKKYFEKIDN